MVVRSALLAIPLLALTFLAGCSEAPPPDSLENLENEAQKLDVEATATTGVIRGIVVDEAIRPIAGANITLVEPPMETTSNEAGAFAFEALEPGTYFFKVTRRGFADLQSSSDVVAGVDSPDPVRVQMMSVELPIPSVETLSFRMHLSGSGWVDTPAGGTGITCCFVEQLGNERSWFFGFDFTSNGTRHVQLLASWTAQSPAAEYALLEGTLLDADDDGVASNSSTGISPVIIDFTSADIGDANGPLGLTGDIYAYNSETVPVGLSVEQDYDLFVIVFNNFEPPLGYRFDVDGPPVVPPA